MIASINRRAILAGAAAIPALSLPAIAEGAVSTTPLGLPASTSGVVDPIFAVIEKHRAAYIAAMEMTRKWSNMSHSARGYKSVEKLEGRASAKSARAAFALIDTKPTTMAGVFALLSYVREFNAGEVWLESTRSLPWSDQWHSGPDFWPAFDEENNDVDMFGFAMLENIHDALVELSSAITS